MELPSCWHCGFQYQPQKVTANHRNFFASPLYSLHRPPFATMGLRLGKRAILLELSQAVGSHCLIEESQHSCYSGSQVC